MHGERGDLIIDGLVKLLVTLAVIGLVVFELCALAVGLFQLDALADDAAAAALAAADTGQDAAAAAAAASIASHAGATLTGIEVTAGEVRITVARPAPVLVIDRVGLLDGLVEQAVTKTRTAR